MPEVKHTHALASVPVLFSCLLAHFHDRSDRLMRRRYRQSGLVDAFPHLVVCMAEPGRANSDQQVVVANFRNWNLLKLILLGEL